MDDLAAQLTRTILEAADPGPATAKFCNELIASAPPTHLLAIGKAAISMSRSAQRVLGQQLQSSLVLTTPTTHATGLAKDIPLLTADHPLATGRNVQAASRVLEFVRTLPSDAHLVVLLSGGGSALLTLPAPPVTLEDIRNVSDALMRAGCDIRSLNTVRKHIEQLKGGRLAQHVSAERTSVAAVSDVIGDDLSTIASGPFTPDPTTFAEALSVLDRFGCASVSGTITRYLEEGARGKHTETPKPDANELSTVEHRVILSNHHAVNAGAEFLRTKGFHPYQEHGYTGEARTLGKRSAELLKSHDAVVIGGEPIVTGVEQGAQGGPMQEAALAAAVALEKTGHDWLVLALATDGRDGPTDAAGAIIDRDAMQRAHRMGLSVEQALANHDTYPFLARVGALLTTGATGTNINDVLVVLRR